MIHYNDYTILMKIAVDVDSVGLHVAMGREHEMFIV